MRPKNKDAAPTVIVCRADELLSTVGRKRPAAVLSIEHPGVAANERGYAPRLTDGTPQMVLTFWDTEEKAAEGGPDIAQVEQGLAFVMEHIGKGDVVIHCNGGIARSTAMALGVLSLLHPLKPEKELIDMLLKIRPIAAPNIIVVEMVDALTGRNGKLLQAFSADTRMIEARKQAEISRQNWARRNAETYAKMHPEKFPQSPRWRDRFRPPSAP